MSDGEAKRMTDPAPQWSDSKDAFWPRADQKQNAVGKGEIIQSARPSRYLP